MMYGSGLKSDLLYHPGAFIKFDMSISWFFNEATLHLHELI
jgi:hypothetical protein